MKPSREFAIVLLVSLLVALALVTASCGAGSNSRATRIVREYLAPDGSHPLEGLKLTKLSVTGQSGERTLHLQVTSDGSAEANVTLNWLVIGGTSDEGWVGDLNKMVLGLAFVEVRVTYASGIPDELNVIDVARHKATTSGGPGWPDIGPTPPTTGFSPSTS